MHEYFTHMMASGITVAGNQAVSVGNLWPSTCYWLIFSQKYGDEVIFLPLETEEGNYLNYKVIYQGINLQELLLNWQMIPEHQTHHLFHLLGVVKIGAWTTSKERETNELDLQEQHKFPKVVKRKPLPKYSWNFLSTHVCEFGLERITDYLLLPRQKISESNRKFQWSSHCQFWTWPSEWLICKCSTHKIDNFRDRSYFDSHWFQLVNTSVFLYITPEHLTK